MRPGDGWGQAPAIGLARPSLGHPVGVSANDLLVLALGAVAVALLAALAAIQHHGGRLEGEVVTIVAPPTPGHPDQFLASLHALLGGPALRRLLHGPGWVSFELLGRNGSVSLRLWIPLGDRPAVESLLRAAYPGIDVVIASVRVPFEGHIAAAAIRPTDPDDLPIRSVFDGEPLAPLLWTLGRAREHDTMLVQVVARPASWRVGRRIRARAQWLRDARRAAGPGRVGGPTRAVLERAEAMERKASAVGFHCAIRLVAAAADRRTARGMVDAMGAGFGAYAGANRFAARRVWSASRFLVRVAERRFVRPESFVLSAPELAALWHVPSEAPPQFDAVRSPQLPPPAGADRGERLLGRSNWPGDPRPIHLSIDDSRRHLHVLGATGSGKTTALLNLAAQDVAAGRGVGVLDPKGDLVEALLARIPRDRIGDVVLVSPDADDRTIGVNPLELGPGDDRDLVAENALTIFRRIYERFWGPRTDDVLKAALLTLLRVPGSTLAHVPLLLTDPDFRARTTADLREPFALEPFWRWYGSLTESQRLEAVGPLLNKLRDFLLRVRIRRLLCQPRSTVDLARVMNEGGILLADLSVGRWGEGASALVGSFLVAKLWQATLARTVVPEEQRRDFFLFIDEFQQFLGIAGPFADALAQARSLRLSLTLANQHLGQLPAELREAIASNARSRAVFQCGQDDATYLAREFAPLDRAALLALPRFSLAARISIGGETARPCTLTTLPPPPPGEPGTAERVRRASLERYGRPGDEIDRELEATLVPPQPAPPPRIGRSRRP